MKLLIFGSLAVSLLATACSHSGTSASTASNTPLLVANRAMSSDVATYALPSQGGLVGSMYVEPRSLLTVPDSVMTGCSQMGNGALGLDAYLSQPSWASQQMIITDVYVPNRPFTMGFPTPAAFGASQSVQSFFALKASGYFHLQPGETEGDYQFALIADDSARLEMGLNDNVSTLVDDEKPASFANGSCIVQTQGAHMSCTSNWSSQTSGNVRIVHLRPGDQIPLTLSYWQGPGQELAMMAFYRKVPSNPIDASCGQELGFAEGSAGLNAVLSTWTPITFSNLQTQFTGQ